MKLYCFQYHIKENKVIRLEYDADQTKLNDYFVQDENDDGIFILAKEIENPQRFTDTDFDLVNIYTLEDDVNRAMSLITGYLKDTMDKMLDKLFDLGEIYRTACKEQNRIKEEYPSGMKPDKE